MFIKILLFIFCLLINPISLAATTIFKDQAEPIKPFFILLGIGQSFSKDADISVDLSQWDPANQGYSDDLGRTVLYTAGLGYQLTSFLAMDIEVTERPTYSYSKFQTPLADGGTPGFAGTKTRKFDLENTSIMANFILNGQSAHLFLNMGGNAILQPIIGAGAGIGYNTVSDFHSVKATSSVPDGNDVASTMANKTESTFVWQAFIAAEALLGKQWAIDLGYRYFDGGNFESNDYFTSTPAGLPSQITVHPWKGNLTANEWFLNLKYLIG